MARVARVASLAKMATVASAVRDAEVVRLKIEMMS